MSLHRLVACRRWSGSSRNAGRSGASHLIRWQSSGAVRKGGAVKKLVLGLAVTGAAGGGVFAYSNYNPVFKNQMNDRVPGFGAWSDKAADMWVDVTDYFNPKPKSGAKKDAFVIEHNQAKIKACLEELKKTKPVTMPSAKSDEKSVEKEKGSGGSASLKEKSEVKKDAKTKSVKEKDGSASAEDKSGSKPEKSKLDDSKSDKTNNEKKAEGAKKQDSNAKTSDAKKEKKERLAKTGDSSKSPPEAPTKKPQKEKLPEGAKTEDTPKDKKMGPLEAPTKKPQKKAEVGQTEDSSKDRKNPSEAPTKEAAVPSSEVKKLTSPPPSPGVKEPVPTPAQRASDATPPSSSMKGEGKGSPSATSLQTSGAKVVEKEPKKTQPEPTVSDTKKELQTSTPKVEAVLSEAHKKWKSDIDRVLQAQQNFMETFEKFLLSDPDQKEAISEARNKMSVATAALKKTSEEFSESLNQLESLVAKATAQGQEKKASAIAGDIAQGEFAVDLGQFLVNMVVAGHRYSLRSSKDAELKEFFEAASKISTDHRSSVLEALKKKLELLSSLMKETEALQEKKIAQALEDQKKKLEKSIQARLERSLQDAEARHQRQLLSEADKISSHYNSMLREQLRLENETHVKELEKALKDQAEKLGIHWSSEMDLKLSTLEGFYQTELARALARLGGLHTMVDGVLSAGQKTMEFQALRTSCDTLIDSLDRIDRSPDTVDRYTLGAEVASLRRAAGQDPFIATVLDAIPPQAIAGEGIQPMGGLRERFDRVKRICKRVALVPETGGGVGTYVLSYLQSLLTIRAWFPDPTITSDSDPAEMHTYQLLHQADARLKKGDLEGAVLYMNHLQGEAGTVARDWLEDARLYLETRQAVLLVQTYMAASTARPALNLDNIQID